MMVAASFASASHAAGVKLASEKDLLSSDDLVLRHKLRPFVDCLNGVPATLSNLVRPYREVYAGAARDPAHSEVEFFSTEYEYTGNFMFKDTVLKCADGLAAAANEAPKEPALDALAASYEADLRKLNELAPKVEAYYVQKDYRDDKMARGRAMNAEYDPLLTRLLAEGHQMFVEVGRVNIVIERRRVDAIERLDGKHLRWEANDFMLQARTSLNALAALVAAKNVSRDAVLAQVTPLEARYAEAKDYAAAHPEEDNDDMNLWSRIASYAADFVTAAKEARRDIADKPDPSKLSEHVSRMRYEFNNIIGEANVSHR